VINALQVLPNTSLWERLEKEGRLAPEMTSGDTMGRSMNYVPTRPKDDIMDEYLAAWEYLYEPSRFLTRAHEYFLTMRPTRRALALQKGEEPLDAPPPGVALRSWVNLIRLLWRQGIVSRHRSQFWRQLLEVRKKNPSRFVAYVVMCKLGMDISDFAAGLCKRIRAGQADADRVC
jgi:hypothetical protein